MISVRVRGVPVDLLPWYIALCLALPRRRSGLDSHRKLQYSHLGTVGNHHSNSESPSLVMAPTLGVGITCVRITPRRKASVPKRYGTNLVSWKPPVRIWPDAPNIRRVISAGAERGLENRWSRKAWGSTPQLSAK